MQKQVKEFILEHWDKCVRHNKSDNDTLIGLPYKYVVPSEETFDELYYWDTYFTNKGLILSGKAELAKSNTDNILYLVNRFGFMPNGNRTFYLKQSQPPFLSLMVRDIFAYYGDCVWLASAYSVLKKEYDFWMKYRITDIELNHYDGGNTPVYQIPLSNEKSFSAAEFIKQRNEIFPYEDEAMLKRHFLACCESGWDTSPRWGLYAYEYVQVDLNSLMYMFEENMSMFATSLSIDESDIWSKRADKRKSLMYKYLVDKDGLFSDYNVKTKQHSEIFSAASIYPLFAGVADNRYVDLLIKNLHRIELKNGIVTCEKNDIEGRFQWDYPNGWACIQSIAFSAFKRYGHEDIALRIAQKYIDTVEKVFLEKKYLIEKYNVVEVESEPINEHSKKTPSMMGWSAGVYMEAVDFIEKEI